MSVNPFNYELQQSFALVNDEEQHGLRAAIFADVPDAWWVGYGETDCVACLGYIQHDQTLC